MSNIDALSNLTELEAITLRNLPNLENIDGLNSLTNLNYLALKELPNLENIDGLNNLTTIGPTIVLDDLPSLTNVDGFINLKTITSENSAIIFYILNCDQLMNLDGFSNLVATSIRRYDIRFLSNDSLTDFCGLRNYVLSCDCVIHTQIGANGYNPSLSQIASETECSQ